MATSLGFVFTIVSKLTTPLPKPNLHGESIEKLDICYTPCLEERRLASNNALLNVIPEYHVRELLAN